MTRFTPEQFALVAREVESMIAEGEMDETWRVLQMFARGRFNFGLADFPEPARSAAAQLGTERTRSYPRLLEDARALPASVFETQIFGELEFGGRSYPFVKFITRPPASLYETRVPICLVAGIHGDEPDGVFAALEFARRFAANRELTSTYSLAIYPCLNPVGYERMTRENGNGKDLNREFRGGSTERETHLIETELRKHACTGFISGHSDYESFGVYAYATGAVISERLAKPALFQASDIIPINTDPIIDSQPASLGIISMKFPGSLGPLTRGQVEPFDITIETPNLFSLRKRIEAQAVAFETILQEYRAVAAEGMYL